MLIKNGLFSSESVSEGHPDKLADQISDAVLDAFLSLDKSARVACETLLADQLVVVAGEFKTVRIEDFQSVQESTVSLVRKVLQDVGYRSADTGIDPQECEIKVRFNHQAKEINQGVDRFDGVLGAGDQGLMFGYACNETVELMPAPIVYAHRLMLELSKLRKLGIINWLEPDAKSQVTFRYEEGIPKSIETVVVSTQHSKHIGIDKLRSAIIKQLIDPVIPKDLRSKHFKTLINPTKSFIVGGPKGDAGLTGRKIIVDTYGGAAPHGGGAFSGKDPSKVDRSAAYMARFLAKQAVARGWATKVLVQLAYAIGVSEPVSFAVETFGTSVNKKKDIAKQLVKEFDLRPQGIIETLDLLRPIYRETACYGHFGRSDVEFPWEKKIN